VIGAYDGVVLERIRMATRGVVVVSVMLDGNRVASGSWVEPMGLASTGPKEKDLEDQIEEEVDTQMARLKPRDLKNDDSVEDAVRKAVSRVCSAQVGKKPVTKVLINRLE
jgi:ribonuclease J